MTAIKRLRRIAAAVILSILIGAGSAAAVVWSASGAGQRSNLSSMAAKDYDKPPDSGRFYYADPPGVLMAGGADSLVGIATVTSGILIGGVALMVGKFEEE